MTKKIYQFFMLAVVGLVVFLGTTMWTVIIRHSPEIIRHSPEIIRHSPAIIRLSPAIIR